MLLNCERSDFGSLLYLNVTEDSHSYNPNLISSFQVPDSERAVFTPASLKKEYKNRVVTTRVKTPEHVFWLN